jgi:hypothetical protein
VLVETIIRFLAGGIVVLLFSLLGEVWKPKTFAGIFSAAPSVALVALTLAYLKHGSGYVRLEASAMIIGSVAMFAYCSTCVVVTRTRKLPTWAGASLSWLTWFAAAGCIYFAVHST